MHRPGTLAVLVLAILIALSPSLGFARAGFSSSFGSRGMRTYSPPPMTSTAPSYAAPMQRSMTPQPGYAPGQPSFGMNPGMGMAGGRSPFVSGLMGGLIGAGIGGLLFGGGLFHGISGFGGLLGLLLQIFLVFMVGRWLLRRLFAPRQPALAGASLFAANAQPQRGGPVLGGRPSAARPSGRPVAIGPGDYAAFEQLLRAVQAAWSAHDLGTLQRITSPEMTSYFAEQLADQTSRGVRNVVDSVQLVKGDLSEAWAEASREYATVAMRFGMTDVTYDAAGRVVDGDPRERVEATEIWTFMRATGGKWVLSAIQQAR